MSKPKREGGLLPLLQEPEPFLINGRTFKFKKLGVAHTFKLINIIKNAAQWGYAEAAHVLKQLKTETNLAFALAPLFGIPECEVLILDFLQDVTVEVVRNEADTAPVEVEANLYDPEQFPMGSELILIANLAMHPSVTSFLATLQEVKNHPAVEKATSYLQTMSTDSGKTA